MSYNIIKLITYLLSVALAAYGVDAIDFTRIIKKNAVGQTRTLYIVLVISLAYLFASFVLGFITINLN